MGLGPTRGLLLTGLMLAGALLLDLRWPRPAPRSTPGQLTFAARGAQGPIRGVIVVEAGVIAEVRISESSEGLDRRALHDRALLRRFRGQSAQGPVMVDATSGASVSARLLVDAVNQALRRGRP
ncbi:MAG: FMN-binding protein [Deltaproteobacteria bacterium]|nr:FMN-binding protein [Deltaproteobacteria bacterium]